MRPVFSAKTVRLSKSPLEDHLGYDYLIRDHLGYDYLTRDHLGYDYLTRDHLGVPQQYVQYNAIQPPSKEEQSSVQLKTRPESASFLRCNCNDAPPSVNRRPFFMSRVCGRANPNMSVPIIASVPEASSQTSMGNSVSNPMNDTTQ